MDKPYLLIVSAASSLTCPPYFADDPRCGKTPDGLYPLSQGSRFAYEMLTPEDKQYLAIGSNYVMPKNTYVRLACSLWMVDPASILLFVDGYPLALMHSMAREYLKVMQMLQSKNENYPSTIHEVTAKKGTDDESITNWSTQVEKALRVAARKTEERSPAVIVAHVDEYKLMKVRMDNATAWAKAHHYRVKNFHTEEFSTLFPFVDRYIKTVEQQKVQAARPGMPPSFDMPMTPTDDNTPPTLGSA